MKRVALSLLVAVTACTHGIGLFRKHSVVEAEAVADSLYWGAVSQLDPANKSGSVDTAITWLESYLKSPVTLEHDAEARGFLALARDAAQLAKVQAALQTSRERAVSTSTKTDSENKSRDDDAAKEIARLKEELARANDELERIKKRLAAPPSKP